MRSWPRSGELRLDFPAAWVCLTGGEPLLQDISGLVRDLKKEGLKVQVETNGTIDRLLPVDWYTVSPKPKDYFYQPRFRKTAKEVKLVVSRELDLDIVRRVRKEFPPETPIFLQPESNRPPSAAKGDGHPPAMPQGRAGEHPPVRPAPQGPRDQISGGKSAFQGFHDCANSE